MAEPFCAAGKLLFVQPLTVGALVGTPSGVPAIAAGSEIVVEELLDASFFALLNGEAAVPLASFGNQQPASVVCLLLCCAGSEIVVEEFLDGEEASFFALIDGEAAVPLASAQDHKAVGEGDTGPNTGGMGAYSPAPVVTPDIEQQVGRSAKVPTTQTPVC